MRVAIYARYSSDNQREESIDAQIRAIQEYCIKHKYTIVKIYKDEAKSATTDNRPNFLQMIEDSRLGLFDSIIVHKLDRFSRNRYDSAFYKKKLKENKVRLFSVLENLDDSPESIILESLLEGIAEYYSKNLSREVMKGMKETALQAKHNGGIPPLGYKVNKDKTYTINEREAQAVRIIFDKFTSGYGYGSIAEDLNTLGYKMKSGKPFKKHSVREILLNEKYTGTYVFNRRADGKTTYKLKSEDEIIKIPDAMPAIISKELFIEANSKIEGKKVGKRIRIMNYLLTGKMFCGECNKHYVGAGYTKGRDRNSENPSKYYNYACTGRKCGCKNKPINKNTIENLVIERIKDEILNEVKIIELTDALCNLINKSQSTNEIKLKEINTELSKLKAQIDKDFQLFYDDLIDKNILADKVNSKKSRISDLETEKIMLESKSYSLDKNKILEYLNLQKNAIDSGDEKLIQNVINLFVEYIIIYNDKITINLGIDEPDKINNSKIITLDSGKVECGSPPLTISLSIKKWW